MKILLVNPSTYDFSCHDFWMKPYGFLKLAGLLASAGHQVNYFDFLDRSAEDVERKYQKDNPDGRGQYPGEIVTKPVLFRNIPRHFRRYGRKMNTLLEWLAEREEPEMILLTCTMTYWVPGLLEVIETLRKRFPGVPIKIGGTLATLMPEAFAGWPVEVIQNHQIASFLSGFFLKEEELYTALPFYGSYRRLPYIVTRLSYGCPLSCSYCANRMLHPKFRKLSPLTQADEVLHSMRPESEHVVFYDDTLLLDPDSLTEFCAVVLNRKRVTFQTPNGLSCRSISRETALLLRRLNFGMIHLSLETTDIEQQIRSGGKVVTEEFQAAVRYLLEAGHPASLIRAYLMIGHPSLSPGTVESSIQGVRAAGVRPHLVEFSPIPGTPDGDLTFPETPPDPLETNKTFQLTRWADRGVVERLKALAL